MVLPTPNLYPDTLANSFFSHDYLHLGKYQLLVFPEAGHFIHEDAPAKTAAALVEFQKRNDRSTLVLPPKVSDMLKMKAGKEGL